METVKKNPECRITLGMIHDALPHARRRELSEAVNAVNRAIRIVGPVAVATGLEELAFSIGEMAEREAAA